MSEMFKCRNDSKHFKSGRVVILLSLCSRSTGKCNRTLTTMGIDLGENSTQSLDRGIGVQDERFVEIRILQQGRGEDGCAKCIKGFLVFSGPLKWCGLFDEELKWTGNCSVVLDETSVLAGKAKKGVEFLSGRGYGPGFETSNFDAIWLDTSRRDDMA